MGSSLAGLSALFGGDNPVLLFFGLVVIFLQRSPELPAKDDITGVEPMSKFLAAGAGFLAFLTLAPFPAITSAPTPLGF